ncbi:D-alanyl-D-alanine carboxypeptidase family protein [Gordonia sp. MP11Mi]|uniref:D-alanyl-D-alanine carboxypeptidase-like core domain-containing protein n=1 Tax=Gordonia sp. MP11Mi TaxID=3022769 RepID=A0AA97CW77_9ACTN
MNIDNARSGSRFRSPLLWGLIIAATAVSVALTVALVVTHLESGPSSATPAPSASAPSTSAPLASTPSASGDVDGYIPDSDPISPFADVPAIQKLDDGLRTAVRSATRRAQREGVDVRITSGWRSVALQDRLRQQTIEEKGEEYAATHVKPSTESEHIHGRAVDIGPTDAADWMSRRGAEFGLCQVYSNELWHYELIAKDGACPPMRADSTE